ncbi:MAG: DUF1294 domain-containing protein [Veillonella sp.]|nr:DUF1294 domain-containing protein [Veillonella sp.]
MGEYIVIGLAIWNLMVAIIYGIDKVLAIKQKQRISEFTLLFLAFCFAGLGALLGMVVCHHKTLKWKFKILVPIALLWEMFAIGYGYFYVI